MANALHAALGLADTPSLNEVPDGKYDGVVFKDELVYVDSKDELSHVFTYQVTDDPTFAGRSPRPEWFLLVSEPRLEDGSAPAKGAVDPKTLKTGTPAMSDQQRPWYINRLESLGHSREDIDNNNVEIGASVGIPVTFEVKTTNGYANVRNVKRREQATPASGGPAADGPQSLDF